MKILQKCPEQTSEKFGKKPEARSVNELLACGIINLDKPKGPTSHEVVSWVKKILDITKAGHSGTLDPKVTGVLPVATMRGTKALESLLAEGKEYVCVMHLHDSVPEEEIRKICKEFTGKIYQRPPLRSAVRRRVRVREIYYNNIFEVDEKNVLMQVGCESGTYMRKLCSDMGFVLGCGGNMAELRRTRASVFEEKDSVTLQQLHDAYLFWKEEEREGPLRGCILPVEVCIKNTKKIWMQDSAVDAVCHGADLALPGVVKFSGDIMTEDMVAMMTLKDELVGLGKAHMDSKRMMKERRGIAVKTDKVVMERGTYPKNW